MKKLLALSVCALMFLAGCEDDRKPDTAPDVDPDVVPTSNTEGGTAGEPASAETEYEPITELAHFDADVLADLRQQAAEQDKVLVIDFWATWCVPCRALFPVLHEAMHEGGRDDRVMLVSISQDDPADAEAVSDAVAFINKQKAGPGAYLQDQDSFDAVAAAIGAEGWSGSAVPAVFVFDPNGELAYAMTRSEGNAEQQAHAITAAADAAAGQ